jgi:hypothetical protein
MLTLKLRSLAVVASLLTACGGGAQEPGPSRLVLGAECPAGSSWDGSRCSSKRAVVATETCPDGRAPDRGECPPPREEEPRTESAPEPPPLYRARDLRPRVHEPRPASLLKVEIQQLNGLLEVTAKESPERPLIIRRIADTYAELAWAAPREAEAARTKATTYYNTIVIDYRNHCASPPSKRCADEVIYYLALEWELLGKLDVARNTYLLLIQSFPQSDFIPYAYFSFGEFFFKEGTERDPSKLPLAEQLYDRVLQFPNSPIAPEAALRQAQIAEAMGDLAKAEQYRKRGEALKASIARRSPAPP